MPLPEKRLSLDRVDFRGSLSGAEIDSIVVDDRVRVLQTSEPAGVDIWELHNDRFFSRRPDVQLRIYGHYGLTCELSFLPRMNNVRRLSVDCLDGASSVDALAKLKGLQSLGIGIRSLESFDFLSGLDGSCLTDLALMATFSKRPSLSLLAGFDKLERLYLEGQQKDIEVIARLTLLQDLTLRSVSVVDLHFLRKLPSLWSLDIKLGGCRDLAALAGLQNLKYLELWQIKGLRDLVPVSSMTGLQYLFLQSLRQVTCLPNFTDLQHLRRVHLENMKGLSTLVPLETAPALEELVCVSAKDLRPKDFEALLRKPTLKRLLAGLGSDSANSAVRVMMQEAGIEVYQRHPFSFRDASQRTRERGWN